MSLDDDRKLLGKPFGASLREPRQLRLLPDPQAYHPIRVLLRLDEPGGDGRVARVQAELHGDPGPRVFDERPPPLVGLASDLPHDLQGALQVGIDEQVGASTKRIGAADAARGDFERTTKRILVGVSQQGRRIDVDQLFEGPALRVRLGVEYRGVVLQGSGALAAHQHGDEVDFGTASDDVQRERSGLEDRQAFRIAVRRHRLRVHHGQGGRDVVPSSDTCVDVRSVRRVVSVDGFDQPEERRRQATCSLAPPDLDPGSRRIDPAVRGLPPFRVDPTLFVADRSLEGDIDDQRRQLREAELR